MEAGITDKFGSGFSLARNNPELFFQIPNAVIRDAQGDIAAPGADPNNLHGTPAGPERWKGYGYINWAQGNATLNLTGNYSSSYSAQSSSPQERVENYLTYDLTGSYEFGDSGWKVYAGARNITNKAFPFFDGFSAPWDPRRVDPKGRIVHLEIRKTYDIF